MKVRKHDERLCLGCRHTETFQIITANRSKLPSAYDTIDSFPTKAWNTKQRFAWCAIDVQREKFGMCKRPRKLRIDIHRKVRAFARQQLIDAKTVMPQQPIGLVKAALAP